MIISKDSARIIFDQIVDAIENNDGRKAQREAFEDVLLSEGLVNEIFLDGDDSNGKYIVYDDDGVAIFRHRNRDAAEFYVDSYGTEDWKIKEAR